MFDYSLDYKNIDFRANPHLYRVGKGEQVRFSFFFVHCRFA